MQLALHTLALWRLPSGEAPTCLLDTAALPSDQKALQYTVTDESGALISYSVPCGAPIPEHATCTCNCVVGTRQVPNTPSSGGSGGSSGGSSSGGSSCSCNRVCTCIPVCQAHKLLEPDPLVRSLAEQLILIMGRHERAYMDWAASTATPAVRTRIEQMVAEIEAGAGADPSRWATVEACIPYLDHADPVVRIMAAQMLQQRTSRTGGELAAGVTRKVDSALQLASEMDWRRRRTATGPARQRLPH